MICLACGKEQNREICWNCWGDYIKICKEHNLKGFKGLENYIQHLIDGTC